MHPTHPKEKERLKRAHENNRAYSNNTHTTIGMLIPTLLFIVSLITVVIGWDKYVGILICILGLVIYYYCHWQLFIKFTTIEPYLETFIVTKEPRPKSERTLRIFLKWLHNSAPLSMFTVATPYFLVLSMVLILLER